jgi:hypothetical protein
MTLRKSVPAYFIIGLIGFINVSRNPRFAAFHTVDILQLLTSGVCFGLAVAAMVAIRRGQQSGRAMRGE